MPGSARRCRMCGEWIDSWRQVPDGADSTMSVCHNCYGTWQHDGHSGEWSQ